ncbi:hypothetical protein SAMN02745111_00085 [Eubacterium uniforme]|uniref:Calcineurin-like phosphoesterase domain-containing protein n=1 Tax=Eubacterium uniforme TaxID=39495 RepID=A0A1T4V4F7_9FIRM|nr:metallophosphoesterase [Eubacterium uniforme]SKA59828.1 hypothetical protein SAMN02745111_00085 [Eubacterium uniforme]
MERLFCAMAALPFIVIGKGMWEVRNFKITKYQIDTNKDIGDLDGKKIMLISDLHNCEYGKNNEKLFKAIDEVNPDYIMVAGDLVVGSTKYDTDIALHFINTIAKKYEVFYANGNHEQRMRENRHIYGTKYRKFIRSFDKSIHILNNYSYDINDKVRVTGFVAHNRFFSKFKLPEMKRRYIIKRIKKRDRSKYNILIAHSPEYFETYKNWGADLVLSGHNHGGIVRLPFIGGVISPQYKIFDRYDRGVFTKDSTKMILSAGLGSHTINFRFNNRPEIVVFTINSSFKE